MAVQSTGKQISRFLKTGDNYDRLVKPVKIQEAYGKEKINSYIQKRAIICPNGNLT